MTLINRIVFPFVRAAFNREKLAAFVVGSLSKLGVVEIPLV